MQNEYPISDLARIFPDMPPEDFFQPFYRCAVDPARIEIDERVVRDLLGLGEDAVASVAKLKPRWDVHLSGDDDQPGYAGESLSSVLGE